MSTKQEIEKLAYKIYLIRKKLGIPGNDKTDWEDAERWVRQAEKNERRAKRAIW